MSRLESFLWRITGPLAWFTGAALVAIGVIYAKTGADLQGLGLAALGLILSSIGVGFGGLAGHLVGEETERRRHTRTPGPIPDPDEDAWLHPWLTGDAQ